METNKFDQKGLKVGSLGFSIANKSATVFDSGDEPFLGTNLKTIGQAVASALTLPQTANRYLNVSSFTTTQNKILSVLEDETGVKWSVTKASTDEERKIGEEKLSKGDYSAFGNLLKPYLFRDGEGHVQPKDGLANHELGLPEENLTETIKALL